MRIYADMDPIPTLLEREWLISNFFCKFGSRIRIRSGFTMPKRLDPDKNSTLRWRTTCLELSVGGEEAPPVAGAAGQHHQLTRQQAGVERFGHKHLLRQKSAQQTSKNEHSSLMQINQMLERSRVLL
jgi:hypothetical protein